MKLTTWSPPKGFLKLPRQTSESCKPCPAVPTRQKRHDFIDSECQTSEICKPCFSCSDAMEIARFHTFTMRCCARRLKFANFASVVPTQQKLHDDMDSQRQAGEICKPCASCSHAAAIARFDSTCQTSGNCKPC